MRVQDDLCGNDLGSIEVQLENMNAVPLEVTWEGSIGYC